MEPGKLVCFCEKCGNEAETDQQVRKDQGNRPPAWGTREAAAAHPGLHPLRRRGRPDLRLCLRAAGELPNPQSLDRKEKMMMPHMPYLQPMVALIAGILILVIPRLLNYIVAIYLIVIGVMGLGLIR